jgi:hypothetical protein
MTVNQLIHAWGKRYFRSYQWDGQTFTAIGRTGITHQYDADYIIQRFKGRATP